MVTLTLEYEPEGLVEKAGDQLNIVERRAEADMENFKQLIESGGREPGGWRGAINPDAGVEPGAEAAAASRGDSGKAGVSGKAVAAGVAAAAAVAAAGAAASKSGTDTDEDAVDTTEDLGTGPDVVVSETVTPVPVVEPDPLLEPDAGVDGPETYPVADDPTPFSGGIGDEPTGGRRTV
jgi:hypothetical protein